MSPFFCGFLKLGGDIQTVQQHTQKKKKTAKKNLNRRTKPAATPPGLCVNGEQLRGTMQINKTIKVSTLVQLSVFVSRLPGGTF